MVSAIIVAAGSSRRMGFDKIFAPLAGKPVLYWSLVAFQKSSDIDEIIVVTRQDKIADVEKMLHQEGLTKIKQIIPGGMERHFSVWNGLKIINSEHSTFIGIHDGGRPLVTPQIIGECLKLARKEGAAVCAVPIPDTVKRASENVIMESVDRHNLWAMQTPQFFSSSLIMQAYAAVMAKHEIVTDEVSAVQRLGKRVSLLQSDDYNFKVTFPADLALAEQIIFQRNAHK